ncbi:ATP-binding cassette domain-containing protein [Streptomyces sp. NBC_01476]|uniref:ATP-binding cassette domain-containing protein n=1 Tax=Streptomyces sp. NBC_01476 TaxID=2903881 RepID=UPI002E2F71E0|nr:ATP-binding cassette domain-containing protein [Streptomyces sp. NBC_01476]
MTADNGARTAPGRRPEDAAEPSPLALEMSGVVKRYPGVVALKNVSFRVRPGEVHAIVGENGAGKSTLMAIACGAESADEGTIAVGGTPLKGGSPREALALGLSIVYQHASVTADLTVEENLLIGVSTARRPSLRGRGEWVREQLRATACDVHPRTRVDGLSPAERQLVEISKAAASRATVLVLDEPTESLTAQETETLFAYIRSATAQGTAVVYISHRLADVKRISDRLTVLRDGRTRGTFEAADISEHEILQLVVGRDIGSAFPPKADDIDTGSPVLEIDGLSSGRAENISLTAFRGEIVGLAGIDGNGQQDVVRALAGLQSARGAVRLRGKALDLSSPLRAARSGIAHLPADRHADGLFLSLSLRENLTPLVLPSMSRLGVLRGGSERAYAAEQLRAVGAKASSTEQAAATLSGGNQQKILLGRALSMGGDVLLAAEPTRGVDVGARLEIYRTMRELVAQGKTVVVMSSDALELQGLCDRVVVFSRGRAVRTLTGDEVTEEAITGTALRATVEGTAAATRARGRGARARFLGGDYLPGVLLALLCVAFSGYVYQHNALFLSSRSVSASLLLLNPLIIGALAQLIAITVGGIDLSVGSVMSVSATALSYYAHTGQSWGSFSAGVAVCLLLGAAVGLVNAGLIVYARFAPVLATLITFILGQGVAYLIRSTPAGNVDGRISAHLSWLQGPVPLVTIVCVVVVVLGELVLRRTVGGMKLRAVGSDPVRAHRLGINVRGTLVGAYVASGVLAAVAGVFLYAVVGIGDATIGQNYLLLSISAVVLGGASIYGGRASLVGTVLGALLLELFVASIPFLGVQPAWQQILPGLMIVAGAGLYTKVRGTGADAGEWS